MIIWRDVFENYYGVYVIDYLPHKLKLFDIFCLFFNFNFYS